MSNLAHSNRVCDDGGTDDDLIIFMHGGDHFAARRLLEMPFHVVLSFERGSAIRARKRSSEQVVRKVFVRPQLHLGSKQFAA